VSRIPMPTAPLSWVPATPALVSLVSRMRRRLHPPSSAVAEAFKIPMDTVLLCSVTATPAAVPSAPLSSQTSSAAVEVFNSPTLSAPPNTVQDTPAAESLASWLNPLLPSSAAAEESKIQMDTVLLNLAPDILAPEPFVFPQLPLLPLSADAAVSSSRTLSAPPSTVQDTPAAESPVSWLNPLLPLSAVAAACKTLTRTVPPCSAQDIPARVPHASWPAGRPLALLPPPAVPARSLRRPRPRSLFSQHRLSQLTRLQLE